MLDSTIKVLTIILIFGMLVGVAKKLSNEFFGSKTNYEYVEHIKDLEAQKRILLYRLGGERGGANSNKDY